jgi:anaerobic selenocysteine-containing dehydrogenase
VDGELVRIDGNPLHPVSRGGLCPKGRAGIQIYYHPARLSGPLQRVGPPGSGEFAPVSWSDALERVTATLRTAQAQGQAASVQWVLGDVTGVMADLITGFCGSYGTSRIVADDYRDGSAEVMRLCQGIETPPAFDLEASDLVLSFGAGLSEAWWALPQAARARDGEPGDVPRWIQVDTRLSRSAASADEWVAVRPGTYGTLALGLAYFILKEGRYDAETVSRYVSGWEDWTDEDGVQHLGFRRLALRHGRPDFVSARTGVSLRRIVSLAKAFGEAQHPVALWDQAVSWRTGGLADALAIHALNILAGSLNRPGGVLIQAPMPDGVPIRAGSERPRQKLTTETGGAAGKTPAAVFLYQANPVASAADPQAAAGALTRSPLVVSFSPFLDESSRFADLVLPDHCFLERWQDAPAPEAVASPVWGIVQPVASPRHNTRSTGDVLLSLARGLGGDTQSWARWSSVEEMVRQRGHTLAAASRGSAFVSSFRQQELRELESRGWWLSHGQKPEKYWETILEAGGWFDPFYDYRDRSAMSQHPDGRIWIFPPEARRRLRESGADLAEGFLPTTTVVADRKLAEGSYPLRLLPFRVLTLASGSTPLMPWLLENLGVLTGDAWEAWAEINPKTAQAMGLRDGQRVQVESEVGAFQAVLRVFAGAQPGVVNVPYGLHTSVEGWGKCRGANPLVAVGQRVDAVTQLPDWYSTQVRVVPA